MRCCSSCLLLTGCADKPDRRHMWVNKIEGKREQAIPGRNIRKTVDASVPDKYTDQFQVRWRKNRGICDGCECNGTEGKQTGGEE